MNHGVKYRIFIPRKRCFWHLRFCSGRMHWVSMGYSLAILFSINTFRRFKINSAQKRLAKQQFPNNSKRKCLTPVNLKNHLIPDKFNSKGDNLGRVEIQIVSEAIRWAFVVECRLSFVRSKSSFYWKYWFLIKGNNSVILKSLQNN